jgi:hypothetical protein
LTVIPLQVRIRADNEDKVAFFYLVPRPARPTFFRINLLVDSAIDTVAAKPFREFPHEIHMLLAVVAIADKDEHRHNAPDDSAHFLAGQDIIGSSGVDTKLAPGLAGSGKSTPNHSQCMLLDVPSALLVAMAIIAGLKVNIADVVGAFHRPRQMILGSS